MKITDELDKRIIALLKTDGRMSNREIGRALDVTEGTIRNRLRRLQDAKAMRLTTVVSPRAAGLTISAFVRLSVVPKRAREAAELAAGFAEVAFSALSTGRYNVVVVISTADRGALARFVHENLSLLPGVTAIDTREIVANVKHRFDRVRIK